MDNKTISDVKKEIQLLESLIRDAKHHLCSLKEEMFNPDISENLKNALERMIFSAEHIIARMEKTKNEIETHLWGNCNHSDTTCEEEIDKIVSNEFNILYEDDFANHYI